MPHFHLAPLPREGVLSPALVRTLDGATAAVNRLGGVGRLLPNPHLLLLPYLRMEAVLSLERLASGFPLSLRLVREIGTCQGV